MYYIYKAISSWCHNKYITVYILHRDTIKTIYYNVCSSYYANHWPTAYELNIRVSVCWILLQTELWEFTECEKC